MGSSNILSIALQVWLHPSHPVSSPHTHRDRGQASPVCPYVLHSWSSSAPSLYSGLGHCIAVVLPQAQRRACSASAAPPSLTHPWARPPPHLQPHAGSLSPWRWLCLHDIYQWPWIEPAHDLPIHIASWLRASVLVAKRPSLAPTEPVILATCLYLWVGGHLKGT